MPDFGLAPRQLYSLKRAFTVFFDYKGTAKGLMRFVAILIAFVQLLGVVIFDTPVKPFGPALDMSKFELVWSDEFEEPEVDRDIWMGHYTYGQIASVRRGGYFHRDMAFIKDGNLIIRTEYKDEGLGGGGPGYYSFGMDTRGTYDQLYGYFEVSCILPKGHDLWAAFWMINEGTFNIDGSAEDGAEIDIFESPNWGKGPLYRNTVTHAVHFDGYGDAHQSQLYGTFYANNPYEEYNTYGVEWNEEGYIFYINGIETIRSSYGLSHEPEYLILSVEVGGNDAIPAAGLAKNDYPADYLVDYVRAYQYKDLM